MRFTAGVLVGLCLAYAAAGVDAGEASASPEEVATWIKQLGSADFDAREKAELALAKTGLSAMAELRKAAQSNDPEIRTRSERLLETLKWATLPSITDLASVLPPENTLYFIGTPNLKDALTRIRKETPLGRLYDHPDLRPLRDKLWTSWLRHAGLDDDSRKLAEQWLDRFGGPYGLAAMKEGKDERVRPWSAFFVGITGTNRKADMNLFEKLFPLPDGKKTAQVYHGISCSFLDEKTVFGGDGLALVRNLVVRSNGKAAMFNVIDAAMDDKKPNLAGTAVYKEARSKISGEPLATLFLNVQPWLESVLYNDCHFAGFSDPRVGFREWKYAIFTLDVQDGLFLEQAFWKVDGKRRGLMELLSFTPVSGRLAALCPPDALLFVSIPMDGKLFFDRIRTILKPEPDDAEKESLRELMEAHSGLKGEAALWLARPQGPDPDATLQTCLVFEALDAKAAAKASNALAEFLSKEGNGEYLVGKAEYQERTCHFMKPAEGAWPPRNWAWCADGSRLLIAERQEVLQQMILRSKQGAKGLDTRPDFQKLLAATPQDQRGGLVYANASELLTWFYTVGLPVLSADAPDEVKTELAKLPKDPQVLLKDLPGILLSIRGTPEGICARAVGGMPVSAWLMALGNQFSLCEKARLKALAEEEAAERKKAEEGKHAEKK